MYNISLSEEQLRIYVTGLDSSIKLIANQLTQNSPTALRNLLPQLIQIDGELRRLDAVIDEADAKKVKIPALADAAQETDKK